MGQGFKELGVLFSGLACGAIIMATALFVVSLVL
jgi:hypothetical protein